MAANANCSSHRVLEPVNGRVPTVDWLAGSMTCTLAGAAVTNPIAVVVVVVATDDPALGKLGVGSVVGEDVVVEVLSGGAMVEATGTVVADDGVVEPGGVVAEVDRRTVTVAFPTAPDAEAAE